MSRKIVLILATVALVLPTVASAACTGNLCNFLTYKQADYGPKDEILKLAVTNKYKCAALELNFCVRNPGYSCRDETPITIKPDGTETITVRNVKPKYQLEKISATIPGCASCELCEREKKK